jgi:ATP/maltotriose-dependent transcriptional regulator MalT
MEALAGPQDLPESHVSRALLQSLLAVSDERYAAAEEILRPMILLQRCARHTLLTGNARLLLACVYQQWNRPEDALSELRPLLAEYERQGVPGLILFEGASVVPLLRLAVARDVRAALARNLLGILESDKARPIFVPTTGQTLSPRETEVLHLVMEGASNRAIGEQLVITERTVKSHVTSILRKLDVTSRTEAAARAREMNLL